MSFKVSKDAHFSDNLQIFFWPSSRDTQLEISIVQRFNLRLSLIFKFIQASTFARSVRRKVKRRGPFLPVNRAPQNRQLVSAAEWNVCLRDRYSPRSGSRVDKTMPSMFIKYSIAVALWQFTHLSRPHETMATNVSSKGNLPLRREISYL